MQMTTRWEYSNDQQTCVALFSVPIVYDEVRKHLEKLDSFNANLIPQNANLNSTKRKLERIRKSDFYAIVNVWQFVTCDFFAFVVRMKAPLLVTFESKLL